MSGFKNDPVELFSRIVATFVRTGRADTVTKTNSSGNTHVQIGNLFITFTPFNDTKDFVHIYLGGWGASDGGTLLHSLPKTTATENLLTDIEGGRFHKPFYPNIQQATEKRLRGLFV